MDAVVETLHIDTAGCTLDVGLNEFLHAFWTGPITALNDNIIIDDACIRGALQRVSHRAMNPEAVGDAILLRYQRSVGAVDVVQAVDPMFGPVEGIDLDNAIIRELGFDDFYTVEDPDNILFLKEDGSNFYINRATLIEFINTFAE